MNSRVSVQPVPTLDLSPYHVFVAAVGYESRARFIVEHLHPEASVRIAAGFMSDRVLDFEKNEQRIRNLGYKTENVPNELLAEWLRCRIELPSDARQPIRIGVDISSFSRLRIAIVYDALMSIAEKEHRTIDVDWFYSFGSFSRAPTAFVPNVVAGPILPSFAGWSLEPDRSLSAIVGLGYGQNKALGAIELVQPAAVWALYPSNGEEKYEKAVRRANKQFLDMLPEQHLIRFDVAYPFECFGRLESLTYGLLKQGNVILFPFGIKYLTICALTVSSLHPSVPVWRVSSDGGEKPINRRPTGQVSIMRLQFSPTSDAVTEEAKLLGSLPVRKSDPNGD